LCYFGLIDVARPLQGAIRAETDAHNVVVVKPLHANSSPTGIGLHAFGDKEFLCIEEQGTIRRKVRPFKNEVFNYFLGFFSKLVQHELLGKGVIFPLQDGQVPGIQYKILQAIVPVVFPIGIKPRTDQPIVFPQGFDGFRIFTGDIEYLKLRSLF